MWSKHKYFDMQDKVDALKIWFRDASRRRFYRYGMPFLVLVVGASFGLKEFATVRYQFRKSKMLSPKDAEKYGVKMKEKEEKPTLEGTFQNVKEIPTESWENIRGPRPWEMSKEIQEKLRKEAKTS